MTSKASNSKGYSSHNSIQLVRGGSPYFDLLEKLIDGAKESIHLQAYIYEGDETGTRITNALLRAAKRGVKVYVLLDGYASRSLSNAIIDDMRKAGIHFRWFEPLFKGTNFFVGRRMHHKVVVADGLYSLVGGMNISNRYNDMPDEPAWLDWAAYVIGEASTELYNRCTQMWLRRTSRTRSPAIKIPAPLSENNNCYVRVRINDWMRNKNQISRSYVEMFHHAESQITIMSSYFLPGRIFRKNLRLAAMRGVRIRIILTKISDVTLAKLAERFFYPWLLKRKIEIYEYRKKVLHGKMAICDGQWVTVGSYNFNDLSAYASIELNLDVQDEAFSHRVDQALENIIKQDCDRVIEKELIHKTYIWNRMIHRMAYALIRFFLFIFTFSFRKEKR